MSWAHKVDMNQAELIAAFERMGCSVVNLSRCGAGIPDLAVSCHGLTELVEVKAEDGQLTPDQIKFHRESKATIHIARCVADTANIVAQIKRRAFGKAA